MDIITTWSKIGGREVDKLVEITLEEAKKLGIDSKVLELMITGGNLKTTLGTATRLNDNAPYRYRVRICPSTASEKWEKEVGGVIKHELYHIYKNDFDRMDDNFSFKDLLKYLFVIEPKAEVYRRLGIKL